MSTTGPFAITFVFYHIFYIIFSVIMITSGVLTRFYLSVMNDNYVINDDIVESFSFTTLCFIVIGIVVFIVSLMSCSILIKEKTVTIIMYLLIMLAIITAEFSVGFHTFKIPGSIKAANNNLNILRENKSYLSKETTINVTKISQDVKLQKLNLDCLQCNKCDCWEKKGKYFMEQFCYEQINQAENFNDHYNNVSMWKNSNCPEKSFDIAQSTTNLLCFIIFIIAAFKVSGILFFTFKYEWNKC